MKIPSWMSESDYRTGKVGAKRVRERGGRTLLGEAEEV